MNFHEGGSRINIGRGGIACASARCNMQRALFAAVEKRGKDGERREGEGGRRRRAYPRETIERNRMTY